MGSWNGRPTRANGSLGLKRSLRSARQTRNKKKKKEEEDVADKDGR